MVSLRRTAGLGSIDWCTNAIETEEKEVKLKSSGDVKVQMWWVPMLLPMTMQAANQLAKDPQFVNLKLSKH